MAKEYFIVLASGTRTGDVHSETISKASEGLTVIVDIGSIVAGSIDATIQGKDRISAKFYDILSSGTILAATTKILTVHPAVTVVANSTASQVVPYDWRVSIVSASGTASYSIGAQID